MTHRDFLIAGFLLVLLLNCCNARIHKLSLKNETRFVIHLNTFGFYANGTLDVNLLSLRLPKQWVDYNKYPVGFSLSKSRVTGVLTYTAEETETCPLSLSKSTNNEPLILFIIDVNKLSVNVRCLGDQDNHLTAKVKSDMLPAKDEGLRESLPAHAGNPNPGDDKIPENNKTNIGTKVNEEGQNTKKVKRLVESQQDKPKPALEVLRKGEETVFELGKTNQMTLALDNVNGSYNFSFHMMVGLVAEGLYNLNFHYCQNRLPGVDLPYSLNVEVTEKNPGGYLSAAEIPLSRLYICMAGIFFTAAMVWVYTLMKHRYSVFKIHWLMAALAFTKSISLVFHSINYHFINTEGHPIEGWAVMYYITHLLKGALLFITLALIGTGWAFVKYILSDKEKKIFMIVIPLQVLANVAYIIIESTEEGSSEYALWKEILFLVDLICCGAILFPVVWSIRHLQEASSTDAAMNLEKLKLFRHYYVMIVCYIYFTRIIVILLKVTMPFQWQWCYEFLVEVSTLIFFVLTGYKFRPASNNPYLQLPLDEEDVEMDEVVTESGALEGISKVKKTSNGRERQRESTL
ncbi:protein GPR108 isoform X2 [Lampris incognitus]|uniref:protein GPR108 isoform X2 n=1 Tax=Lampris incognitus TaxID=2546036 RepID=UPI0024B5C32F|nr:protein GPR108 isoform X2 [Lampris incognitus]